ncbi:hypothetical protein HU200_015857 [Digitaria exilis]|uniref:Bifunctional inhibitor/plant lipid transfer protein/seed storage helical domain-containing protein n=1 Tax=Digitaria exilis TaxID=1010633 RepID=A0A835F949_9POAL|nr:hypothetical protein HU200_015857 [Digitaria exilis]
MTTKTTTPLLAFAVCFALFVIPHAWGEQDCYKDKVLFKRECDLSIRRGGGYIEPFDDCCNVVRRIDMTCVYRIISKMEEETKDVHYVYFVSQDCHKPVPPGNKCGSKD